MHIDRRHALIYYLFLQCSRDPQDLHSFPTRRSSDLDAGSVSGRPAPARWPVAGGRGLRASGPPCPAASRDRKSTRLNSSHMSISYAVFCLKKKNTFNDTVFVSLTASQHFSHDRITTS